MKKSVFNRFFTFLPLGLYGDGAHRAQFAHVAEHMLIRGTDPHGNFERLGRPKVDMAPEDVAMRDRINEDWADILYDGAKQRRDY